jgi:hypothetical protein
LERSCAFAVATSLTGSDHRHWFDWRKPSVWPVWHRQQVVQISGVFSSGCIG